MSNMVNLPSLSKGCRLRDEGGVVDLLSSVNTDSGCCGNNIVKIKVKTMTLKERLLTCGLVQDNEFLDKYVDLIERNYDRVKQKYVTNNHHIIPKQFFKKNGLSVDNSASNVCVLLAKDHVLAHYYLALCVSSAYRFGMIEAFMKLLNTKVIPDEQILFRQLEEYSTLYSEYISNKSQRSINGMKGWETRRKNGSYMNTNPTSALQKETASKLFKGVPKSEEQRRKISDSNKQFRLKHPGMSSGANNGMYGKHHSEHARKLIGENTHKTWERLTDEQKRERAKASSIRMKQFFKDHPETRSRLEHKGNKNTLGYKWITDPTTRHSITVSPDQVQSYLDMGFVLGRIIKKGL